MSSTKDEAPYNGVMPNTITCPNCKTEILAKRIQCLFCGYSVADETAFVAIPKFKTAACPNCEREILATRYKCVFCGNFRSLDNSPGTHPQMWCRFGGLFHILCNGYRFDNADTLKQVGIDAPKSIGKIELLCSCSCHDRASMDIKDIKKSQPAHLTTIDIFGTTIRVSSYREIEDMLHEEWLIGIWPMSDWEKQRPYNM